MELACGRQRIRAEHDRDMRLAWYSAAFERQKKLPDLKTLLMDKPQAVKQTGKHHALMLSMIGLKGQRTTH